MSLANPPYLDEALAARPFQQHLYAARQLVLKRALAWPIPAMRYVERDGDFV